MVNKMYELFSSYEFIFKFPHFGVIAGVSLAQINLKAFKTNASTCEQESVYFKKKKEHTILRRKGESAFWSQIDKCSASTYYGIEANFVGVKKPATVK